MDKCWEEGCVTCPFTFSDESDQAQNYGCLPEPHDIIRMKEQSGHNWACHGNDKVLCRGFANYAKVNRPDLDTSVGGLISYETWYQEGEEVALLKAGK